MQVQRWGVLVLAVAAWVLLGGDAGAPAAAARPEVSPSRYVSAIDPPPSIPPGAAQRGQSGPAAIPDPAAVPPVSPSPAPAPPVLGPPVPAPPVPAPPVAAPLAAAPPVAAPPVAAPPVAAPPVAVPLVAVPPVDAPLVPAPPVTGLLKVVLGSGATTTVSSSDELSRALAAAKPGDTIRMAPGTYSPVVISGSGTAAAPITLVGPATAVITGSGKDYTVHVDGASHWQLVGFGVSGGGKGVMLDNAQHNLLDGLDVGRTGDEAVHFRAASSDNTIQRSTIHDTGLAQPQFGEGVYVGSAKSNWKKVSGGQPDLSMRNRVVGNTFAVITAENVDVKEETAGTLISGNRFDGSATSGKNYADSIVDVKGYDTTVVDNVTTGESPALKNIIETHVITDPATSGCGNTIAGNTTQGFTPKGQQVAVDKKCG